MRVSTEDQSIEGQRIDLLKYCDTYSLGVPFEFTDVMSGSKNNRPGLKRLLAAVEHGEIDCVVSVKMDRIGRSIGYLFKFMDLMETSGVRVIFTSQGLDSANDNPMAKLFKAILAGFAEFERSLIQERTISGLRAAKARGVRLGRVGKVKGDVTAIVADWRKQRTGYRDLAVRLGGVSVGTAWKLARKEAAIEAE